MPKGDTVGRMHGFQLWANLPASLKMTAPRYQEVKSPQIPEVTEDDGTRARILCGNFWGKKGPVDGIAADPVYLDVTVPPGKSKTLPVETTCHAFAYVFAGSGKFCNASRPLAVPTETVGCAASYAPTGEDNCSLVVFDHGECGKGERGRRHSFLAGVRQTAAGARGLVRSDCDEYPGAASASLSGTEGRDVFEEITNAAHEPVGLARFNSAGPQPVGIRRAPMQLVP
jgi:hypothetical protein